MISENEIIDEIKNLIKANTVPIVRHYETATGWHSDITTDYDKLAKAIIDKIKPLDKDRIMKILEKHNISSRVLYLNCGDSTEFYNNLANEIIGE